MTFLLRKDALANEKGSSFFPFGISEFVDNFSCVYFHFKSVLTYGRMHLILMSGNNLYHMTF